MNTKHKKKSNIRVAIVIPVFGIPSEIWSVRQCLGFQNITPVVVCWQIYPGTPQDNYGLECHQISSPWQPHRTLMQRVAAKLGLCCAVLPRTDERIEIEKTLKNIDVDAILCHFSWTGVRVGAAVNIDIPIVWHVHGRDVSSSLTSLAYRSAVHKLLPTARKVVAVGSFQLERLKRLGLRPDQGELIPCGAPLDEFSLYPRVQRTRADKLRIISVGRFSEEKGVLETIRAFSIVVEKVKNAELVLIGDGPLWKDAEELALKLGHRNNIKFRGLLHPNSVAQELAMGHIYTQHSREHNGWIEGFGVTITEAGAAGLPVVVSCFGGIVDQVFDGENGFLFPPGDIAAQARFIICLANDEELRREMGMKASQVASSFNSAIQTKKLERLLLELINR